MVQPFIKMQSIKKGEYNSYTLEGFIELLEFYKSRGTTFYIDEWAIEINRNPSKQKNNNQQAEAMANQWGEEQ